MPQNNLQESGRSFHHVGPRNWTWIIRLGERYHCPMKHLTGPSFLCLSLKKIQWMFCLYKFDWTLLLLYMARGVWTILWCCPPWLLRLGLSPRPGPHVLGYTGWLLLSVFPDRDTGIEAHTTVPGFRYFFMGIMVIKFRSSCLYIKHFTNRNIPQPTLVLN